MTNLKRGHKMKLFIPTIGTKIKLLKDWKFKIYYERRNDSLLKAQGFIDREQPMKWIDGYGRINFDTSLPAGTQLTVDRIYIRKGSQDFDSVSFWVGTKPKGVGLQGRIRFWAKLEDVNDIEFELIS
jgi:hypothetical protein